MKLFVYGLLRRGGPLHHHLIAFDNVRRLGAASAPGRLVDLGRYPGLLPPSRRGQRVRGEVYEVPASGEIWRRLDRLEGTDRGIYRRGTTLVRTRRGESWRAQVYRYTGPLRAARPIPSGEFAPKRRRGR